MKYCTFFLHGLNLLNLNIDIERNLYPIKSLTFNIAIFLLIFMKKEARCYRIGFFFRNNTSIPLLFDLSEFMSLK